MTLFPMKNLILRNASIFVFQGPGTFRYSHDRIAKKNAPINDSHIDISSGEIDYLKNCLSIEPVTATCCFSPGSRDL